MLSSLSTTKQVDFNTKLHILLIKINKSQTPKFFKMEETFIALEKAIQEGKIKSVSIRKSADLVAAEISTVDLSVPSSATTSLSQENSVRYVVAAALEQIGIPTPDAENAKGKVLPSFGSIPF